MIVAAAQSYNVPVYVLADSFKIRKELPDEGTVSFEENTPDQLYDAQFTKNIAEESGIKLWNPVFESIPRMSNVTLVTEKGVLESVEEQAQEVEKEWNFIMGL